MRGKPSPPLARPLSPLSDSSSIVPPSSPSHTNKHKRRRKQKDVVVKVEPAASAKMKKKELVESEEEEEVVMKEEEEEEVVGGGGGGLEEYCQPSHTPFPPLGRPLLHSTQHSLKSGVRIRIGSVPIHYSMDFFIRICIQWIRIRNTEYGCRSRYLDKKKKLQRE